MHSANIPNGSKWSESNLSLQYACAAYISTTPPAFWPQLTVKCLKHLDTLKCFNWRSYIPGDSGGYCILYFENRLNLIKLYIKLPSALHGSFTDPSRILHGSFTDPVAQALAASMPKNLKAHRTHGRALGPLWALEHIASRCKPCKPCI